jgi:hypothetical protein
MKLLCSFATAFLLMILVCQNLDLLNTPPPFVLCMPTAVSRDDT